MVLGDSIAAGAGIESVDARFSGRLAQRLGEHWSVVVLARRGWDTTEQRRALSNFAYEPHVGLLAYYVNDVVRACAAKSAPFAVDLGEPPALLAPLVARSHLANHLYWSAAMYVRGPELARAYFEYLQRCYDSAGVWRALAGDLDGLVRDARSRGARVVALCFPALGNIPATADHTRKVAAFLAGLGVEAIDLAPVYSARDVDELVVHAFDQHPNARVHAEVAKLVLPLVTAPVSRP